MEMFWNVYFLLSVVVHSTWIYLRTYPYLVSQMNPEIWGENWKEKGLDVDYDEREFLRYMGGIYYWVLTIPRYTPLIFFYPILININLFWFGLSFLFAYFLAFVIWSFIFKNNFIKAKTFFIIMWWIVSIVFFSILLITFLI